MIWPFRRNRRPKKPPSALRIILGALIAGTLIASVDLQRPLEDFYIGARDWVRARPADGKVVVVAVDDRTFDKLGQGYYSRAHNAVLLDKLFAMGVKRVYFDEMFSIPVDKAGDDAFAAALKRHPGKVNLGSIAFINRREAKKVIYQPLPQFSAVANVRSLKAAQSPFGLSEKLYYADKQDAFYAKSVSADIAGVEGKPNKVFWPDWSIQYSTVPTVSMLDVLDGRVDPASIRGKDILVGVTAITSDDFAHVLGQGWFPGVYVHAIGAQTLREGTPRDLGWVPPMLFALALIIAFKRARTRGSATGIVVGAVIAAPIIAFVFDSLMIRMAYIPAYLAFGVAVYRLATFQDIRDAGLKNASTLMPNLSALREEPLAHRRPIIAMRIRNYAAVGASFSESVEMDLISEVARRLTLPGETTKFYQAEDVIYWLGPALSLHDLENHVAGLARLMESLFVIQGRKVDVLVAFGIDANTQRPIANRIGRALLAADTAASKHQSFMFNTSDDDEESAWDLSLMSELDEAIEHGDIWIAYQPQFDLRNDGIMGVEALVRWQHPIRGAISPEAFILQAEAHNRIGRLTFHVLTIAANATRHLLKSNPNFRLSINISASLMERVDLPRRIIEVLDETSFPAANLTLEVTESAPFAANQTVADNLRAIAALGIDLSIDDYGTGNATLDYLRSVPCQEIKIDRRFVTGLTTNSGDLLLVESTIELAHGLGRRVIAEGIEEPETLELLRSIGCDIAQGYYLAKPMRIDALDSLLMLSNRIRAA